MTKGSLVLLVLLAMGCGGGASTPADRLEGDWIFVSADGSTGIGLDFNSGSYVASILIATSASSADAEVEKGVFTANDTQIIFTPQQWTCLGPYPVYAANYSFSGQTLVVTGGTTLITFSRNTTPASGGVVLTMGCIDTTNNTFTPEALAPVSN